MATILLLNGPNLNLLGTREPDIYGAASLQDIEQRLRHEAQQHGHQLQSMQSNAEHELITAVHNSKGQVDFIIFNPAALTHTSIALRDALLGVAIPFIEVHLSNIHAREHYRQHSYFSDIAAGVISGLGTEGYALALSAAINQLQAVK